MATISSLGIGSGLDSESIVTKLAALERAPLRALQNKASIGQAKITSFAQIQSQFSALSDAASGISSAASWKTTKASSGNSSAATITATSTAPAQSFTLDVDRLALKQSLTSVALTSAELVGAGTLTFRVGTWSDAPAFTPSSTGADITVTATDTDTLNTLATKLNAANVGVVATVFSDGTSQRLILTSKNTGADAGFRIQVSDTGDGMDTDNAGLSRFGFDPEVAVYGFADSGLQTTYGQDAQVRFNGAIATSKSNTFVDNLPGITINVLATTTTGFGTPAEVRNSVAMAVSEDVTPAVKSVNDFVTAYNALVSNLADLTKYDSATKTPSVFQGDSAVVGLLNVLRNMAGSISDGSAYKRLSDVGVQAQRNGTLSINTVKLSAAANNGDELSKLFITDNKNPLNNGFALKFSALAKGVLQTGGLVNSKAKALDKDLQINSTDQQRINDRAAATEARLRKQYSALDTKIAGLSALNAYVTQQVTTWNKSTG